LFDKSSESMPKCNQLAVACSRTRFMHKHTWNLLKWCCAVAGARNVGHSRLLACLMKKEKLRRRLWHSINIYDGFLIKCATISAR
jgi:hypothetical protein